jgi:hypothetical protein
MGVATSARSIHAGRRGGVRGSALGGKLKLSSNARIVAIFNDASTQGA